MNIKLNQSDIEEVGRTLKGVKTSVPVVLSRSINKTMTNVRTYSSKKVREILNLKAADVKKNTKVFKATVANVKGSFFSKGKPIPFITFIGTRALAGFKGVSLKMFKNKPRIIFKHAFIQTMKSGHIGVFEREAWGDRPFRLGINYAHLPLKWKLPIEELTGPRIEDELAKSGFMSPMLEFAAKRLDINLEAELNFALSKL